MSKDRERLAQALMTKPGLVMLWGATDTGKSTLALQLANYCRRRGRPVALVDADVGQSDLGPPGTAAMGLLTGPITDMAHLEPAGLYFVGDKSPRGRELQCATAVRRLVDRAFLLGAQVVIVDTTGLIQSTSGRMLKTAKFELLQPEHLVALQRDRELDHLLQAASGRRNTRLWNLRPHPGVHQKSRAERARRRSAQLARHLENPVSTAFDLDRISLGQTHLFTGRPLSASQSELARQLLGPVFLHGENLPEALLLVVSRQLEENARYSLSRSLQRPVWLLPRQRLQRLLLGLHNDRGICQGVGILTGIDWEQHRLHTLVPAGVQSGITEIWLGHWQIQDHEIPFSLPPAENYHGPSPPVSTRERSLKAQGRPDRSMDENDNPC